MILFLELRTTSPSSCDPVCDIAPLDVANHKAALDCVHNYKAYQENTGYGNKIWNESSLLDFSENCPLVKFEGLRVLVYSSHASTPTWLILKCLCHGVCQKCVTELDAR